MFNSQYDILPFQELIHERSGMIIPQSREGLLSEKIQGRMKELHLEKSQEYLDWIRSRAGQEELKYLIESSTIGESSFFRHEEQWRAVVEKILPDLLQRVHQDTQKRNIKIWSAGCSTGEEPYSLLIALAEHFPSLLFQSSNFSLVATDLNSTALEKAKKAVYSLRSLSSLSPQIIKKYFNPEGNNFQFSPQLKAKVKFYHHNLINDSWSFPEMQELDLMICRNVLIYFDHTSWMRFVKKIEDCLPSSAYLLLGPSEYLRKYSTQFILEEFKGCFFYKKR